ncbi:hypothetical protein B0H15DRAFT_944536 [Mycena belliarum]|uniref:Uncharacterized protein n=1 Tax=Mycena belliarum TaxID=1033014 RepID=A0AAD6UF43_9AGAR|nr:hypothetical protein B0H15DRAFT_944536 [Mycena belliae]
MNTALIDALILAEAISVATPPPLPPPGALGPDGPLAPTQLWTVLESHDTRFLKNAVLDKTFFQPAAVNSNQDAFVTRPCATTAAFDFRAVIFGEVAAPIVRDGMRTSFGLKCPNWQTSGWDPDELGPLFYSQFNALEAVERDYHFRDLTEHKTPKIRSWIDDRELVINVSGEYPAPVYMVASKAGMLAPLKGPHDPRTFPFAPGNTLLVEVSLHCTEAAPSETEHHRVYTLVAHQLSYVKIRVPTQYHPAMYNEPDKTQTSRHGEAASSTLE